jgi:hypothetical protein
MTCQACRCAEAEPNRGGMFYVDCMGCQARAIATSHAAHRLTTGDASAADELREQIERVWKHDYAAGRVAVWTWIERIKAWKAKQ